MPTNPLYFAYGSNLNIEQMAQRCPNARPLSVVNLKGYALTFCHSGVATIVPSKETDSVPGVIWRITDNCETSLDQYEGYPHLYDKNQVIVHDKNGNTFTPMVYIMNEQFNQPSLPFYSYYKTIQRGYASFDLPIAKLHEAIDQTKLKVFKNKNAKKSNHIR